MKQDSKNIGHFQSSKIKPILYGTPYEKTHIFSATIFLFDFEYTFLKKMRFCEYYHPYIY